MPNQESRPVAGFVVRSRGDHQLHERPDSNRPTTRGEEGLTREGPRSYHHLVGGVRCPSTVDARGQRVGDAHTSPPLAASTLWEVRL